MTKKIFSITLICFLSLLFFSSFVTSVQAAGLVPCGGPPSSGEPACTLCHFFIMIDNIVDFLLLQLIPILAAIMIAIGGFLYIISQANPDQLNRVKSLFTAVAIGLLIVYGAWLIINVFLMTIGALEWEGFGAGWNIINC